MRIFIDIGHPAHVHYFKHLIWTLQKKGHEIFISARDKDCTLSLLEKYDLSFYNRGVGANSLAGKFCYLIAADAKLVKKAKAFRPELFLSFGSSYAAQVAWLLKKPHIAFEDTEIARFEHLMYVPFTDAIFTPIVFKKSFGRKQIRFSGYMELAHLHPRYFAPDESVLDKLNVGGGEKYIVVRFVSWSASHDMGHRGFRFDQKLELIKALEKSARIFISSEDVLPPELDQYRLDISPEQIHQVLYFASLYLGEGATTASEAAVLGVPAIYVNDLKAGTIDSQIKYGLIFQLPDFEGCKQKAAELLNMSNLKKTFRERRDAMLKDQIDVTAFMDWVIEDYPDSISTLKSDSNYQLRFM